VAENIYERCLVSIRTCMCPGTSGLKALEKCHVFDVAMFH